MKALELNILLFWILLGLAVESFSREAVLTMLKCHTVDTDLVILTKCYTKITGKSLTESTLNLTLLQEVTDAKVLIRIVKKSNNRYNNYLYRDTTYDVCRFFKNPSKFPFADYLFKMFKDYTNLNHTCPFKDYVLLNRLKIDVSMLNYMPLSNGEYGIFTTWFVSGKERISVNVYLEYRT